MIGGDVPMRLTRNDVWRLVKDRFSANEIAYLAGVSVEVARGMIVEATPRVPRESPACPLDRAA